MTISPNQLRAARMLLCMSQVDLSKLARVGVATIRKYETGLEVGSPQVELMRAAVEAAGAILLDDADVSGRRIGNGVAVVADGDLPEETRKRMAERAASTRAEEPRGRGRPIKPRKAEAPT